MTVPPDETGTDWTGYPHRKPNPIVHLVRWAWRLFLAALVIWGAIALYLAFRWWMVPILLLFAFAVFVLFRNRARRARR
jgi:fatty acid desaturase